MRRIPPNTLGRNDLPGQEYGFVDKGILQGVLGQVRIEWCQIVNVHPDKYTVDARTRYTWRAHLNIPWMSPYLNKTNGEGLFVIPEVGSYGWLCMPSDGTTSFVLGFGVPGDLGRNSYVGNRPDKLLPGDVVLRGRDDNVVALYRGGAVDIYATPICRTMYIPTQNTIREFVENYYQDSPGGQISWRTYRYDQPTDDFTEVEQVIEAPVVYEIRHRNFSNESLPVHTISLGGLEDLHSNDDGSAVPGGGGLDPDMVVYRKSLSHDGYDPGATGVPVEETGKYFEFIDNSGNSRHVQAGNRVDVVTLSARQHIGLNHIAQVLGQMDVAVAKDVSINVGQVFGDDIHDVDPDSPPGALDVSPLMFKDGQDAPIGTPDALESKDLKVHVTGRYYDRAGASRIIEAPIIYIGAEGASEPAVLGWKLLHWLANHTHDSSAGPTTVPLEGLTLPKILSRRIWLAGTDEHWS